MLNRHYGSKAHAVEHSDFYSSNVVAYMARHNIKPGLSDFPQKNVCRGETKSAEEMAKPVENGLEYINN